MSQIGYVQVLENLKILINVPPRARGIRAGADTFVHGAGDGVGTVVRGIGVDVVARSALDGLSFR